ncbi:hypothetical protein DER46DRAFT_665719 [Fusarium sp. MPI-SDFR-AT-0072]|nr:hypothetical protein DER46DRAFT_665719 [Fusarium sp. MPI-SDFR-AT-0072]
MAHLIEPITRQRDDQARLMNNSRKAYTYSTPKKTTSNKGASALLKASGKGKSAYTTKSTHAAMPMTSPVKSPKKKLICKYT